MEIIRPLILEFTQNAKTISNCNVNLTLPTQGYAAETRSLIENNANRVKRAIEGLITSSQLAAKLSYLSWNISSTLSFSFAHAMHSFCEYVEQNRRWAMAASISDSTTFARVMFNNSYLSARKVGPGIIKNIAMCCIVAETVLSSSSRGAEYYKRECFEYIPLKIDIRGEKIAFVNQENMIIHPSSRKASCQMFGKQIIRIENEIYEADLANFFMMAEHIIYV